MTNKKITDLPSALAVGITDEVELVQGGVSKRATVAKVLGTPFPFVPAPLSTISPVTASKLVGRGSVAGAGVLQEITLGTGLTMVGTTLNAAGGGGTSFGNGWDWATDPTNLSFVGPQSGNTYFVITDDAINGIGISMASNAGMRIDTSLGGLLMTANNASVILVPDAVTQFQGFGVLLGFAGASAGQPNWGWHSPRDGTLSWSTYDDSALPVDTFFSVTRTGTAVNELDLTAPIITATASDSITYIAKGSLTLQSVLVNVDITAAAKINLQASDINLATSTQATVGGAGGASALPATPSGYIKIQISGSNFVLPYYARV